MASQISGYKAYLATVMPRNTQNKTMLVQKKTYEMYCSHTALYGS